MLSSIDRNTLALEIPPGSKYQLIYRTAVAPLESHAPDGVHFVFCERAADLIAHRRYVWPLGWSWLGKSTIKLFTARRFFYFAHGENKLLHTGWLTLSRCRQYPIAAGEAVIERLWTAEAARRRGIATYCTRMAMQSLAGRTSMFYIDTENTNYACQRMIEKCGFGEPIGMYLKRIPSAQSKASACVGVENREA